MCQVHSVVLGFGENLRLKTMFFLSKLWGFPGNLTFSKEILVPIGFRDWFQKLVPGIFPWPGVRVREVGEVGEVVAWPTCRGIIDQLHGGV